MIKINKPNRYTTCDSCDKHTSLMLEFTIGNSSPNKLTLCEDCANSLSNVFYDFVRSDCIKPLKYNENTSCVQEVEDEI